jgi:phage terminase large subunit-like protein
MAELAQCDEVVGALDLSGTRDLTALTLAGRRKDGKIITRTEYWTPLDTLHDRARADKVHYDLWVDQGHMVATPGRAVDYAFVARRLAELTALVPLYRVCFDPYRIAYLEPEIDDTGCELELISHPQGGYKTQPKLDKYGQPIPSLWMPRSIELLEMAVGAGRIQVQKNPCLTWNSASAVLVATDDKGNLIFSKRKSRGRIDGIVTLAMAVGLLESSDGDDALDAMLEGGAIT